MKKKEKIEMFVLNKSINRVARIQTRYILDNLNRINFDLERALASAYLQGVADCAVANAER